MLLFLVHSLLPSSPFLSSSSNLLFLLSSLFPSLATSPPSTPDDVSFGRRKGMVCQQRRFAESTCPSSKIKGSHFPTPSQKGHSSRDTGHLPVPSVAGKLDLNGSSSLHRLSLLSHGLLSTVCGVLRVFPSLLWFALTLRHCFQGNIAFSVSRLFGWQRTNRLYSQGSGEGDGTVELPHFSSPSLVAKHSHEERLPYLFFLKQGLPSFAYANFMVSKAVTKKNFNRKWAWIKTLHTQCNIVYT